MAELKRLYIVFSNQAGIADSGVAHSSILLLPYTQFASVLELMNQQLFSWSTM